MDKVHSLSLLLVVLAACSSVDTAQPHIGMYAVLDPASGLTYHVPLRYDLRGGLYATPSAGRGQITAATSIHNYVGTRESPDSRRASDATMASGLSQVSALQDVSMRTASLESTRRSSPVTRVEVEATEVVPPSPAPVQGLNLKLETEFRSAKRLVRFATGVATLGPIGKLAVAELVPWAKQAEKVHVRGGADLTGNPERNRELAITRAKAVSSAFVAAGVDREKITKSFCIDCYVAQNGTELGRRINRRVDVELVLKHELFAQLPPPVHTLVVPDSAPSIHAAALR
jgi:outer membrane protein OmpA-like peptidoglycan-associated protein